MKRITILCCGLLLAACSTDERTGGVSATGVMEAVEVNVAARTAGTLLRMDCEEGMRLHAGDTVAVVDPEQAERMLEQAEAAADMARAQLRLLRKGTRAEDRAVADAQVARTEAALENVRKNVERLGALLETGSIPQKEYDDAQAGLAAAEAAHASAVETRKKFEQFARPEELQVARARVRQAEALAALRRRQVADCTVLAPSDGLVTERAVEPGELVNPGMPLVTLSRTGTMELMIYVPEPDLGRFTVGSAVRISIDSHPDRTFPGTVTYVASQAEFTPKNVQTREDRVKLVFGVKIAVPNPDGIFKAGMPADAEIAAADGEES